MEDPNAGDYDLSDMPLPDLEWKDVTQHVADALLEPSLMIASNLLVNCDDEESSQVISSIYKILAYHHQEDDLLKWAVTNEYADRQDTSTLFRENGISSQILKCHIRLCGKEYLRSILEPFLAYVIGYKKSCEIDTNIVSSEQAEKNTKHLTKLSNRLITSIIGSSSNIPAGIRKLCGILYDTASSHAGNNERGKELTIQTICTHFFLRFICPNIICPEGLPIKVSGSIDNLTRRNLVLISKVLQNSANQSLLTKDMDIYRLNDQITQYSKEFVNLMLKLIPQANDKEWYRKDIEDEVNRSYVSQEEYLGSGGSVIGNLTHPKFGFVEMERSMAKQYLTARIKQDNPLPLIKNLSR